MDVVTLKELILTFSTLGQCGGLERTDFLTVSMLGMCGSLEISIFYQFILWVGVVVVK